MNILNECRASNPWDETPIGVSSNGGGMLGNNGEVMDELVDQNEVSGFDKFSNFVM